MNILRKSLAALAVSSMLAVPVAVTFVPGAAYALTATQILAQLDAVKDDPAALAAKVKQLAKNMTAAQVAALAKEAAKLNPDAGAAIAKAATEANPKAAAAIAQAVTSVSGTDKEAVKSVVTAAADPSVSVASISAAAESGAKGSDGLGGQSFGSIVGSGGGDASPS